MENAMEQMILKNGKYVTLDKKIPQMKALLLTDATITASADAFILEEIAEGAQSIDLKNKALIPGFHEPCFDIIKAAKSLAASEGLSFNEALKSLCTSFLNNGVTSADVIHISAEDHELLKSADEGGYILIDLCLYFTAAASAALLPAQLAVDNAYTGHIKPGGVCMSVDAFTAREALARTFKEYIEKKQQVMVFADAKEAIDTVLNSYRDALIAVNGEKTDEDGNVKPKIYEDLRPIIVGCAHLHESQLTLLQSLGFTPVFAHDVVESDGDKFMESLSQEEYENIYPLRSAVRRGLAFSVGHLDSLTAPDIIHSMYISTHRQSAGGYSVGFEQTINTDQALLAQTLFPAYQSFEDLRRGSLTMTKKADLCVLSINPLEESADALRDAKVLMTIKDGRIVYKA